MTSPEDFLAQQEHDLISAAVHTFHQQSGVPVALGAQVFPPTEIRIIEGCGLRTDAMRNLRIDSGSGVGGRVFSTQRVMGVTDYLRSQSISHELDAYVQEEGIRSLAAAPVVVQREVRAVLYAGVHAAVRLSDRILEELTHAARNLEQGIAVMDATIVLPKDQEPAELEEFVAASEMLGGVAGTDPVRSGPEWEQIRQAHTRLRILATQVSDPEVQREIEAISELLITSPRMMHIHLSTREIDVLSCVAMGLTNIEAAAEMGVGAETVKSYLRNCMRKLDAHNRYEAVSSARSLGVIP